MSSPLLRDPTVKFYRRDRITLASIGGDERVSDAGTPATGDAHRSGFGTPFAV